MARRGRAADLGFRLLSALHRGVLAAFGWRVAARIAGMPIVELHTIGRRSGLPRTVVLSAPIAEPGRLVLVASRGGDDRHPGWYANVVAHPEVEVTRRGARTAMVARTATPEERAELWPRVVAAYAGYADYQRRTTREIPLVVCTARG
jgi:deazaflavin-dependent oxidoreductase (nitroreductase family)